MSVKGRNVLFGLKIVSCSQEETFGNLISMSSFSETRVEKWTPETTSIAAKCSWPIFPLFFFQPPGLIKLAWATENQVGPALFGAMLIGVLSLLCAGTTSRQSGRCATTLAIPSLPLAVTTLLSSSVMEWCTSELLASEMTCWFMAELPTVTII